jgi:hypothetical protein
MYKSFFLNLEARRFVRLPAEGAESRTFSGSKMAQPEPYIRHLNEAWSSRKKKNTLSEERSDEFVFFPRWEAKQE